MKIPGFVSKIESSNRLKVCKQCPNLLKGNICNICKCHMNSKVLVEYSKCPEGKW